MKYINENFAVSKVSRGGLVVELGGANSVFVNSNSDYYQKKEHNACVF